MSDVVSGDVVLDLGCGAGADLFSAAAKVGRTGRVIGVEMAEEMIAAARANIAAAGIDYIEVRRGIIEDLPVADESIDWVISNCVINLSPNKPQVFAEIARVLRPGGRMRVADMVVEDIPDWIRRDQRLYESCIGGAISEAAYVAGLRAAGLIELTLSGHYVYDRHQLAGIIAAAASPVDASHVAGELVGRVWSVYISATKPLSSPHTENPGAAAESSCCPPIARNQRVESTEEVPS